MRMFLLIIIKYIKIFIYMFNVYKRLRYHLKIIL